jgi:two-component system, NtrC family, sensor histidine kinase HydH
MGYMEKMQQEQTLNAKSRAVVASLVGTFAVNFALATFLLNYITSQILMREGALTEEVLQSVATAENAHLKLFETPAPSPALLTFAETVTHLPGMVRANIYSPDGFIRYSTEKNLVGLKFTDNDDLSEAFDGKLNVSFEMANNDEKEEHIGLNQSTGTKLMESYMPLRDDKGTLFAVIEFYRKSEPLENLISNIRNKVWAAAAISGLTLFLMFYGLATRLSPRR